MPHQGGMATISRLDKIVIGRQTPAGGWRYFESTQISVEATCLAVANWLSRRLAGTTELGEVDIEFCSTEFSLWNHL
jgi:hypothetical protein